MTAPNTCSSDEVRPHAALDVARKALATILPSMATFAGRPTSGTVLVRSLRGQPWDGYYTRVAGHSVAVQKFGPTLIVGRSPAPWQQDADLVLRGAELLAELRAVFGIPVPSRADEDSAAPPTSPPASAVPSSAPPAPTPAPSAVPDAADTAADTADLSDDEPDITEDPALDQAVSSGSRRLFGVYRHFAVPADAIPPELAGVADGSADLEAVLRRTLRYTGAGARGYRPTFRPVLGNFVLEIPGDVPDRPYGLRELSYEEMRDLNRADGAARLAAARARSAATTATPSDTPAPAPSPPPDPAERKPAQPSPPPVRQLALF
ncbi:hypothetical protein [Azospirillum sp. sgz302134]